ncbi:MAG: peptide ABC transporter substrate-binding protein [Thermomicrobiales bacterium]
MPGSSHPGPDEQLEMMKERLLSAGVKRRDVLKIAAAATGAAVIGGTLTGQVSAGPSSALRSRMYQPQGAEEQVFYHDDQTDNPTSFDFNLNLYCGAPAASVAGLLTFDENLNAAPDWADRWEPNEDASVWTFYIRPDNTGWSDGTPVTAHDFVFSWARQLDPASGAAYAGFLFDVKNAGAFNTGSPITATAGATPSATPVATVATAADLGLKAIDDWTFEVTMEGPRGYFPQVAAYIAATPAPRWQIEEYGDKWAIGDVPIVSAGPFKVDNWDQGVSITLAKNPNYWDADNITLETVYYPIHPGANSVLLFEEGSGMQQVDHTILSSADFTRFSEDPEKAELIKPYVYPGTWWMLPQVTMAPFDQIEVRRALSHAIDRDRLATVTNGLVTPAFCMVPPGVYGFLDDPSLQTIQNFDPAAAMEALVGTEFEGGQNWPEMTMYMRANEEQYNADIMANDIVAQIKENLNWDISIQAIPLTNFTAQLNELKWPLVFIRWFYDYPDPNNGYADAFYSKKSSGKRQAWANEEFDDLSDKGKAEADPVARLAIYLEAETVIQEDVGYIPLAYRTDMNVFKPWVKGVPINSDGYTVPDGNIYVRMLNKITIEGRE